MHPAVVAVIVLGGVFVLWGGYEAINTIYEWQNDRREEREYEEYVKAHKEKYSHAYLRDDDDDEDPLELLDNNNLRHRNQFKHEEEDAPPQYEISEMERNLSARRNTLQKEQELLYEAEAELNKKKQEVESKGNSIMGVFHDSDPDHSQYELLSTPLNIREHGSDSDGWCDVNRERSDSASTNDSFQRV